MKNDSLHTPPADSNSQRRVRFGAFEADFHTQELFKQGTRLKLSGQPLQILESLLSRPGALVSRDELQKKLWPDAPFTDSNHGLNAAVNKLRETLGDSAEEPKYIETLPRRGYRFIGSLEAPAALPDAVPTHVPSPKSSVNTVATASPVEELVTLTPAPPPPTRSFSRWLSVVAALGILLCGIGAVGVVARSFLNWPSESASDIIREPDREVLADAQPIIDTAEGEIRAPRKRITREPVNTPGAGPVVPVPAVFRTASTLEPTTRTIISGDGGAAAPQFSPDGKRIAFMSNRTGPWQIWVSNADGSHPMQISFTDSAGTPRWSPDGRNIAFDGPGKHGSSIFIASADGSGRTTEVAEGLVPSYSRDGKWIYFASERSDDWQVWKVPSSGGNAIQVTHDGGFAALEGLDGYLYYAKSRYPSPEVWRLPLARDEEAGGDEEQVSEHLRPRTWSSWTVTKTGILFVEDLRNGKTVLSLYDPVNQVVRDVAPLRSAPFWMAATSDGKRAIMNDARESQITMVENLQ